MNEKQPYEKHLADKLNQLTQPGDANKHWPQMKALLDRNLPEGSGRKKRPGSWWMYGIIAGILIIGSWFGTRYFSANKKDHTLSTTSATATNQTVEKSFSQSKEDNNAPGGSISNKQNDQQPSAEAQSDLVTTSPSSKENLNNKGINNEIHAKEKSPAEALTDNNVPGNSKTGIKDAPVATAIPGEGDKGNAGTTASTSKKKTAVAGLSLVAAQELNTPAKKKSGINKEKADFSTGKSTPGSKSQAQIPGKEINSNSGLQGAYNPGSSSDKKKVNEATAIISGTSVINAEPGEMTKATTVKQEVSHSASGKVGPASIFTDSLESDYASAITAVTHESKSISRFKTESDRVKALKNRSVGTGDNKNLAFGLSLPMGVPLGDQRVVAYNITGGANTALDYFPMPHIQYHINEKSFVQAEVQFMSPQYIQPALVFQSRKEVPGNPNSIRYISNSVYASKLYYFSLPIGIHYSPFKNFYMGSGMQFSSLISGIAMSEKVGYYSSGPVYRDSLLSQSYSKFKNDSISQSLNGNEFRLMLDANYYWQRFMVGLRYNQALSNYISVRASPTSPIFTDKNKSIQFYLRYNLWEDKKRKKQGLVAGK